MLEFLKLKDLLSVLIRKKRGKIFESKRDEMFRTLQNITESIYQNYSRNYPEITYNYFPYFKLIRNYGNYHFHFLAMRKEHK